MCSATPTSLAKHCLVFQTREDSGDTNLAFDSAIGHLLGQCYSAWTLDVRHSSHHMMPIILRSPGEVCGVSSTLINSTGRRPLFPAACLTVPYLKTGQVFAGGIFIAVH